MVRGGAIKGNSTVRVQVKGAGPIHRALRPLLDPEFSNGIDKANKKAAQSLARPVRVEARAASRRMGRAVRVKRARTGKPDWVVGGRRRTAFFWHFVINGTRDHGPKRAPALRFQVNGDYVRAQRVRGVKPNPIIDRVVSRDETKVAKQIERDVLKGTGL